MSKIGQALREAAKLLGETSDTARLDAELLMAHALGMSRSDMLLRGGDLDAPGSFTDLIARRLLHEPVAYIIGHQEFYGREFLVNSDVLIPRGDSETLIEIALENCPDKARILDLGVGSGALLVTMLAERTDTSGVGVDVSLGAVAIAAANAAKLGVRERAQIVHGDWHADGWKDRIGRFDLILCNPPYVETSAELSPSVRDHEPPAALFSGPDGVDDYQVLIPQFRALLAPGGAAIVEIGHRQDVAVSEIAGQAGFKSELFRDLAHRPRALLLR